MKRREQKLLNREMKNLTVICKLTKYKMNSKGIMHCPAYKKCELQATNHKRNLTSGFDWAQYNAENDINLIMQNTYGN